MQKLRSVKLWKQMSAKEQQKNTSKHPCRIIGMIWIYTPAEIISMNPIIPKTLKQLLIIPWYDIISSQNKTKSKISVFRGSIAIHDNIMKKAHPQQF